MARVVADVLLVSTGLLGAFFLQYVAELWTENVGGLNARPLMDKYLGLYAVAVWPLVLISIVTFWLSGFYSRGRAYQSRFKALVIVQAVSIAHLAFASLQWFFTSTAATPRAVVVSSWGATALHL